MNSSDRKRKLGRMRNRIRELGTVAVAFSAGTDSAFVLKVAIDALGAANVVAVTGRSDSLATAEYEDAVQLAKELGAEHVVVDTEEFEDERYTSNPVNRCYYCKSTLYARMADVARSRGLRAMLSGANADDLDDWRPGLQAATEHEVIAPAAEAGLTKEDIRALSREMGLRTYDKPASPCLSSRIPYGHEVTPEKLRMVERAEAFLKAQFGVRECRVRHYGDLARIEVPAEFVARVSLRENIAQITDEFRALGFASVEVDPRGFRSGSLNDVILMGRRQEGS